MLVCAKTGQKGLWNVFSFPLCFLPRLPPLVAGAHCSSVPPPPHDHAACFKYHTDPPFWVPQEVPRSILQCSRLVPDPFCWQYHQPQPPLPESSFLWRFLWISLLGFCPTLPCPYCASLPVPLLWCELLCGHRSMHRWCQGHCCCER